MHITFSMHTYPEFLAQSLSPKLIQFMRFRSERTLMPHTCGVALLTVLYTYCM